MKRRLVLATLVVGGLLTAMVAARQQQPAAPGRGRGPNITPTTPPSASALAAEKLRDNLYVIRSADPANFTGGNTAVFIRADGITLVDTKVPGWGAPLIAKVKELSPKPITTIINTHTHFDHVGGNPDFPPNVEVVAQENTARLMKESNPVSGLDLPPQPNIFKDSNGRGLATHTFKDRLTVGRGNDAVELY